MEEDKDYSTMPSVSYERINKNYVKLLEEIVDELGIKVARKEWKSKYNSYVVYDYPPFVEDGFEVSMLCTCPSEEKLDFATWLYERKVKQIEALEKNLQLPTVERKLVLK